MPQYIEFIEMGSLLQGDAAPYSIRMRPRGWARRRSLLLRLYLNGSTTHRQYVDILGRVEEAETVCEGEGERWPTPSSHFRT